MCCTQRLASGCAFYYKSVYRQVCGRQSDSSRRLADFYELELNIRGFPSLAASLVRRMCQLTAPALLPLLPLLPAEHCSGPMDICGRHVHAVIGQVDQVHGVPSVQSDACTLLQSSLLGPEQPDKFH